ncbi:hypothetical protein EGW08_006206 [Elysia chlorotica]|uniref:C2H2-type domain-containing protein n=1 Tax=Elysia chlorotica TaxID=188477 RepID=A0A433TX03_ELYCH|nr:hypothetical protein EGW08_006206 [Elysia chlorotica]
MDGDWHRMCREEPPGYCSNLKDKSYPERLRKLKLPTLEHRRLRGDMIEVFKYLHGYYDIMESNQNLDSLGGLPLDMWVASQQQPQPQMSVPRSGFPQVTESHLGREFLVERMAPIEHLKFQQHQQLHHSVPDSSHGPQDRSAWSHLLSLEPSMAHSVGLAGSLPTTQHLQSPFPAGLMKSNIGFTETSKVLGHLPMHNPPASTSASFMQGSHHDLPFRGLSQENVSHHLNQLMNLSKNMAGAVKVPLSKPLTVSTEFSSLESSGDYSPVSPPAAPPAYGDSLLDHARQGKPGKMLNREHSSSALPVSHTQLQGLRERIGTQPGVMGCTGGYNTTQPSLNALSHMSFPVSLANAQKPFASPSDMPLDMTTAVSGKSTFSREDLAKQTENLVAPLSTHYDSSKVPSENFTLNYETNEHLHNVGSSLNSTSERREMYSLTQRTLKSDTVCESLNPPTPSNAAFLTPHVLSISQEKSSKLPKSTPKKSNFYGRDASLFSFSNNDAEATNTPVVSIAASQAFNITPSTVNLKKDSENDILQEGVKAFVDSNQSSIIKNSYMHANVLAEDKPLPIDSPLESLKDSVFVPNAVFDASEVNKHSVSSVMPAPVSLTEHLPSKDVPCCSSFAENSQSVEDQENFFHLSQPSVDMDKEISLTQNNEHHGEKVIDSDIVKFQASSNCKTPKGRKRKGLGASKRAKKQTAKKAKMLASAPPGSVVPQSVVVLERTDIIPCLSEETAQADGIEEPKSTEEDAQYTVPGKRGVGKKMRKKAKVDDEENAPRRSSSRKSKDNAMRLIELQADAGFVSIPGVDDELLPTRMNRKRTQANSTIKAPHPDDSVLSDLSEDSSSSETQVEKDKDDDYVVDAEEAAAMEKDELVDKERLSNKTFVSKKKPGSLRISIKLSGDSSAEIVSGIEDSPVKKKRKPVKKKNLKSKPKGNILPESEDLTSSNNPPKEDSKEQPNEDSKEQVNAPPNSSDLVQTSLMEKYFSSASASKQNLSFKPENKSVKTGKLVGRKFDQKLSKNLVGKNSKVCVKKKRLLPSKDNAGSNSLKQCLGSKDALPKFRCGYCPQRYHTKLDLLTHMDEHMSEMENKDGGKDFTETKIKNHDEKTSAQHNLPDKNDHKPIEEKVPSKDKSDLFALQKFKCGECERVFKSKSLLLDHVRSHTADKPFECDICHKCFAERTLLSTHRKTHGQENLLRCQLCSKAFIHKADLNNHMQSHPKRIGGPHSLKSSDSKNVKQEKPLDSKSQALKKASFASALSGDVYDSGNSNGVPGVLVLKRKDPAVVMEKKNKPESLTKRIALEHGMSSITANLANPQSSIVSKVVKADKIELDDEGEKKPAGKISESSKEEASSDVCTCKECPECVTRFLASFV